MPAGALPEPPRRESWSASKALSRSFRGGSFSKVGFRIGSFRARQPPGASMEEARRAELSVRLHFQINAAADASAPDAAEAADGVVGPVAAPKLIVLHKSTPCLLFTLQVCAKGPPEKGAAQTGAGDHMNGSAALSHIISPFLQARPADQLACVPGTPAQGDVCRLACSARIAVE